MFKFWLESEIPRIDREKPVPPGYRTLYHGTILAKYLGIVSLGKILSWGSDNEGVEKSSMGDMYETGLIWFFPEKEPAQSYAHGREFTRREIEFVSGGIIEVDVPKSLNLVDRYAKLTQQQADILVPHYPKYVQNYKPIKAGLELNYAAGRLWQYGKVGFGQVLKLLKIDGIIYDDNQIAIAAKELPITAAYPVT